MNEEAQSGLHDLSKNRRGLVTIAGFVVCVLLALLAGRGIVFGLVMGTIFSSGMNLGRHIAKQIVINAPADHLSAAISAGSLIAAVIVGVFTAVILAAIQGAVDVSPMAEDDIIARIVKSFFDSAAAIAVAAGVVLGGWTHGRGAN